MLDNGEFIYIIIYSSITEEFLTQVFGLSTFDELINSGIDALDESNTNDLNVRILSIVQQLRADNKGVVQPVRFLFAE